MDGYIAKPVELLDLVAAVERAGYGTDVACRAAHSSVFDREAFLRMVSGREELLKQLLGVYLEDAPPVIAKLRDAVTRKDAPLLADVAHKLKCTLGYLQAREACETAGLLAEMGQSADLAGAAELFSRIEQQLGVLERTLRAETG
jgi:protein-histidine pros-kinase